MNPDFWGPKAWYFIHSVAVAYPDNPTDIEKNQYKQFFLSIGNVLPCSLCQEHYNKHVTNEKLDEVLISKKLLFNWTVDLHNKVNKFNNKKIVSYEEALENLYYKEVDYKSIIIVLLIAFILFTRKNN